ncbi:MAG: F0F1 ATP synthase subunit B [Marinobacter sp.]|nr:F0F1 ATP synthase subunit B [Marinobacter sp.]
MSIDWITVLAQIGNFLVLVWLLKRFLYRPILQGIDAREAEISARMREAGVAKQKAAAAEAEFRKQQADWQTNQQTLVEQARQVTQRDRDDLLAKARERLDKEQQEWHEHLERERQAFTTRLQQAGAKTLLALTRKALQDLADETLEQAMVRALGKRLPPMADDLTHAAGTSREAVVSTTTALPNSVQAQLTADVQSLLPDIAVRFETDLHQGAGVILRVGGAQVAWTVDSYIDELGAVLNEQLAADLSGRRPRNGA